MASFYVVTMKPVTGVDGKDKNEYINEEVEPDHKVLKQSCCTSFIEGKPGQPGCYVFTRMIKVGLETQDKNHVISEINEYTVPEYNLVSQAELKKYLEKQQDEKQQEEEQQEEEQQEEEQQEEEQQEEERQEEEQPEKEGLKEGLKEGEVDEERRNASCRRLLGQYCGPKPVEWLDYMERKAIPFVRTVQSHGALKAWGIVVAILVMVLLAAVVTPAAKPHPDIELERSYKRHDDMFQLLEAHKSIVGISDAVSREATEAHDIGLYIGRTQLPNKNEISKQIGTMATDLYAMSGRLQTFRTNIRRMARNLHQEHKEFLKHFENLSKSSKKQLKKQLRADWVNTTVTLRQNLAGLLDDSTEMMTEFDKIYSAMVQIGTLLGDSHEESQFKYVRAVEGGWLQWFNIFAFPPEVYERDLNVAGASLPAIESARGQIRKIRDSVAAVHDSMNDVDNTLSDDTADFIKWFIIHQGIAHDSFKILLTVLEDK
ncbi:hypothetical protein PGQ11_012660 [Apiospora arundinis]|uniref:Uncharacterized protein n=1 Tax=Apiospora arundinis TaxID=335852 RepID=A0ABR2I2Y8_9PEZI